MKTSMVCSASAGLRDPIVVRELSVAGFDTLRAMGFDGVELAFRDPADAAPSLMRRMLGGMDVSALGTGQAYTADGLSLTSECADVRRNAIERVRQYIALAGSLECPVVIIGLVRGKAADGVSVEDANGRLEDALGACSEYAGGFGVKLAIEPINRYETNLINTVDEGLEFIARPGLGGIGLLLDTFHMNIEEPSIGQSILNAGRNIIHFHVADNNRRAPGCGHINFLTVLKSLKQTDYRGYLSGELLPWPDGPSAAEQTAGRLTEIMDELNTGEVKMR